MSKIAIKPLTYRAGIGTYLQVTEIIGNPPLKARWQIITDIGHPLESGEVEYQLQQWEDWPAGPDSNYIEKIVAAVLGVPLVE